MANRRNVNLPTEIRRKLSGLRRQIRTYVWVHGLALATIWIVLTFWAGLALDYLPVLLGASEMPQFARLVLLALVGLVLGVILYRWVLQRALTRLGDRSMAILLERRFRDLDETLITSVELAADLRECTPVHRQLLATTQLKALKQLKNLRLRRVFNLRPLFAWCSGAALLVLSVGVFYAFNAEAFELGVRRLYLLRDQPWPRSARIEILGIEATQLASNGSAASRVVPFDGRRVKVARGAEVSLLVRADGSAAVVPETCTFVYATGDATRGRVNMTRVGTIRDGFQNFRYEGKPLDGILSDVHFDVVGHDHRVRDHTIEVVDSPAVVSAEVDCVFPEYMVDEATSSRLSRTLPLTSGIALPVGTQLTLRGASNKPLRQIVVENPGIGRQEFLEIVDGSLEFQLDPQMLGENLSAEISLVDTDNVVSERPYRILIEAVEDQAPVVDLRLRGIGSAVTPDVLLPLAGTIRDDYGVRRAWVELQIDAGPTREQRLPRDAADLSAEIDFREQRRAASPLALQPESTLSLVVKAEDHCDLQASPNVGISEHYQLQVVTAQQLLAMLEARELGLRQRFEQIISEMEETRDALYRVRSEGPETAADLLDQTTPADAGVTRDEALRAAARRVWSLRLLRGQRAALQSEKSARETLGAAAAFRDILDELVYNRVDSEDRKDRLESAVIGPLEAIGQEQFSRLTTSLNTLVATMDQEEKTTQFLQRDNPETLAAADAAVQQVDAILREMEFVLQNLQELEDYNELLNIVRALIEDQQQLLERTKEEQRRQVLDLLQ